MSFFYDSCRLGGVLEGAWSAFLACFGVLEASWSRLGSVFWRFGGVVRSLWRRLEAA